jgi:2-amino-4-hydroxy-6-hydroxymethyldihydropteridine diphosphokinase
MSIVYLAFGSNIGNKVGFIKKAMLQLNQNKVVCVKMSKLYKSTPLLPDYMNSYFEQRRETILSMKFVNCVGLFCTKLSPFELLGLIKKIENLIGKKKLGHWLPRVIDIDIIMYKNSKFIKIHKNTLKIPHPEFKKRNFVMIPLMQICNKTYLKT